MKIHELNRKMNQAIRNFFEPFIPVVEPLDPFEGYTPAEREAIKRLLSEYEKQREKDEKWFNELLRIVVQKESEKNNNKAP